MMKIINGEALAMTPEEIAEQGAASGAFSNYMLPLTARQLRLGLVTNGVALEQVEAAIAATEEPQQRSVAQIEWEYASQFERDHPLIAQVGAALGLTAEQIDQMWTEALSL